MGIAAMLTEFSTNSDTVDSIILGIFCVCNTLTGICDSADLMGKKNFGIN